MRSLQSRTDNFGTWLAYLITSRMVDLLIWLHRMVACGWAFCSDRPLYRTWKLSLLLIRRVECPRNPNKLLDRLIACGRLIHTQTHTRVVSLSKAMIIFIMCSKHYEISGERVWRAREPPWVPQWRCFLNLLWRCAVARWDQVTLLTRGLLLKTNNLVALECISVGFGGAIIPMFYFNVIMVGWEVLYSYYVMQISCNVLSLPLHVSLQDRRYVILFPELVSGHRLQSLCGWPGQWCCQGGAGASLQLLWPAKKCVGGQEPTGLCLCGVWRPQGCRGCCERHGWKVSGNTSQWLTSRANVLRLFNIFSSVNNDVLNLWFCFGLLGFCRIDYYYCF